MNLPCFHFRGVALGVIGVALSMTTGCGSDEPVLDGGATDVGFSPGAIADLKAAGVGKYFGAAVPSTQSDVAGATVYGFASTDKSHSPICLWGDPYTVSIRDQGSDNLVIYLEGGGACWTGFCQAKTTAGGGIPATGFLDSQAATNVVTSWNVVYVAYCDGSVFSGDNELPDTGPNGETIRYHHGLRNLSAGLDLAKAKFPNPKRIVLAGSSAGGYGTIIGTAVTRLEYPDTPLIVFNDAGVGLSPADPAYTIIKNEWKFEQFIPASCTDCKGGQQTPVIAWGLRNDRSIRAAAFSSYGDAVVGGAFLGLAADAFKTLLMQQTGAVHTEFPARFERFFIDGTDHTTLILDHASGGIGGYLDDHPGIGSVSDWTRAFVDGTADWTDKLQSP